MNDHTATIRPATRPYRVFFRDRLLFETDQVLELQEHFGDRTFPAVPYFSPKVGETLSLVSNSNESRCPLKGTASYFAFEGVDSAVWTYLAPHQAVAPIADHLGFDTTKGFHVERVD